jgi:hypothetical protein
LDHSFTPIQGGTPVIASTSPTGVIASGAQLDATINPNLAPTVYRFEYGKDLSYSSRTPISESIGGDATNHEVSVAVGGLAPGVTYHFRVVAINFNGVSNGPDVTFTTPAAASAAQPGAPSSTGSGSGTPSASGGSDRCAELEGRARSLVARAKALRGRADSATSQGTSRALRRRAAHLSKLAGRLAAKAKSCAASNARSAR